MRQARRHVDEQLSILVSSQADSAAAEQRLVELQADVDRATETRMRQLQHTNNQLIGLHLACDESIKATEALKAAYPLSAAAQASTDQSGGACLSSRSPPPFTAQERHGPRFAPTSKHRIAGMNSMLSNYGWWQLAWEMFMGIILAGTALYAWLSSKNTVNTQEISDLKEVCQLPRPSAWPPWNPAACGPPSCNACTSASTT